MKNLLKYFDAPVFSATDNNGKNIQYFYEETGEPVLQKEIEKAKFLAAKETALKDLNSLADYYHNQISGATPQKLARYEAKAKAAAAYKTDAASEVDLALLKPEAIERGLTLDEHVEAILKANAAFTSAAGVIEAIQAKGKLMIEQSKTIEELEAIQSAIPKHAHAAFEAWQASLGD